MMREKIQKSDDYEREYYREKKRDKKSNAYIHMYNRSVAILDCTCEE